MQVTKRTLSAETCTLSLSEATVTVNDVELFYRIGGNGRPLLLIHAPLFTGREWNPFLDELGKQHTVIVPDLPGSGDSTSLPGEFSHREIARGMFALLDELGVVDGIRGIGHSSGANILIHMATQQPDRVEAMVLVAGAHRLPVEGRELMHAIRWEDMSQELQEYLRKDHPGGEPQIRSLLHMGRGQADNYEDFDLSPEHLATIPTKTLLVWGDRDPYLPVEIALEMYRAFPRSALWVVPSQGHSPIWEMFGGSWEAAANFPAVVQEFFDPSQPNWGNLIQPNQRIRPTLLARILVRVSSVLRHN